MGRYVCPLQDVDALAGQRMLVVRLADGFEVGVTRYKGQLVAFRNRCPHMGGPVCLGDVLPRTEVRLAEHQRTALMGQYVNQDDVRVVCPWHGLEFSLETGACPEDPRWRLRHLDVYVENGDVYLRD